MRFAICNETFQDWPLPRAFAFARECGYEGVEIAPFTIAHDVKDISPARRAEVRDMAADDGLEVIGLHWLLAKTQGYHLTSPDAAIRKATTEYLKELARCCREMGGSLLVFGSPAQRNVPDGVSMDEAMCYAAEVFRGAMPVLAEHEVTLAIEPLSPKDGNFLLTAADGVKLMKMVDHPNCRLHLDCKAMSSESKPIPQLIRENIQHLVHFHANDANLQGPGFGEIDFVPIFQTLHDVGYDGWVSVEVFDYSPGVERLARESIEYMKECEGKVT